MTSAKKGDSANEEKIFMLFVPIQKTTSKITEIVTKYINKVKIAKKKAN